MAGRRANAQSDDKRPLNEETGSEPMRTDGDENGCRDVPVGPVFRRAEKQRSCRTRDEKLLQRGRDCLRLPCGHDFDENRRRDPTSERWLSGRKRGFAKPVTGQLVRRFESCPLRLAL